MNEKIVNNSFNEEKNTIEKEEFLIETTLSKTKKLNDFLDNIASPSYSVSLNDIALFEKIFTNYKKYDLFDNASVQKLLFHLTDTLKLLPKKGYCDFDFEKIKQSKEKEYRLRSLHSHQVHPMTCSVVCYLMAANIYKSSIRPSKEKEISLYNELRGSNSRNVELYNLVKKSVADGFYTKVYSQFDYKEKHFDNNDWETRRQKYLQAIDECKIYQHFKESANCNIDQAFLRGLLQSGEAVLVNGTTSGGLLHMRLFTGYKEDSLIVSDPLSNRKEEYSPELFELTCNPPAGKWCMSISNKDFDFYTIKEK